MSGRVDIAIVGAGIAGASLAAEAAPHASVLLVEAEDQPGYHSTGRSAAFWSETYGGPLIQPLTSASGPLLAEPAAEFHEGSFLKRRGAIHIADNAGLPALARLASEFEGSSIALQEASREDLAARIPGLRQGWTAGLLESGCADIDVAALHGAYLRAARRGGAALTTGARLRQAERQAEGWRLATSAGTFEARLLVNAAGAWADEVAAMAGVEALGIRPYRRTIVQLRVGPPAPADLPLVIDASGRFYFKPEAGGRLWLSPHDETPCAASDCAPEELDVALAIERLQQVVDWQVERVEHSWAGLRSFAPDRLPVYGFAPGQPDFFWCAGQGGFGIQTAPAAAKLASALLLSHAPDPLVAHIDAEPYAPGRLMN
ncbi:MAG TPA: FAD-dependent oxidoreductase [Allosphingosinicella sp.]|jgi:D-arginine dehydrogenase